MRRPAFSEIVEEVIRHVLVNRLRCKPSLRSILLIQAYIRGWRGRKEARKLRAGEAACFELRCRIYYVREIQRHVRGFLTRRNVLNSASRRRFVSDSVAANAEMKLLLEERYKANVAACRTEEEHRSRAKLEALASRSHHLISTGSIPGVYSSSDGFFVETLIRKLSMYNTIFAL